MTLCGSVDAQCSTPNFDPPNVPLLDIANTNTPRPERISLKSDDAQIEPIDGFRNNSHPDVSSDGNLIAWVTAAQEVVVGKRNTRGRNQIYVRDRGMGTTSLVTAVGVGAGLGNPASGSSNIPRIVDNHRIFYHSTAANIVTDTSTNLTDVFEYDYLTGTTVLLSRRVDDGVQGDGESFGASPSDTGRFVAFTSDSTNLVSYDLGLSQPGGGHPYMDCLPGVDPSAVREDIFLLDRGSGFDTSLPVSQWNDGPSITWITVGRDLNGNCVPTVGSDSREPQLSGNGCRLVFQSKAKNLVSGLVPTGWQIYVWDRSTSSVQLVSRVPQDPMNPTLLFAGDGDSVDPAISDDGRWVVFRSNARDLLPVVELQVDDDIFVVDLDASPFVATRLNTGVNGTVPEVTQFGDLRGPCISPGGRWVSLSSNVPDYLDFTPQQPNNNVLDTLLLDRDADGNGIWGDFASTYLHLEDPVIAGPLPYGNGWTVPFIRFTRVIDLPNGDQEQFVVCASTADNLSQGQSPADTNATSCSSPNCGDDIYRRVLWSQ